MVISHLLFLPCAARLGSSLNPDMELHRGPELHCPFSIASHFYATCDDFAHRRTVDNRELMYLNLTVPEKERAVPKWKSNRQLCYLFMIGSPGSSWSALPCYHLPPPLDPWYKSNQLPEAGWFQLKHSARFNNNTKDNATGAFLSKNTIFLFFNLHRKIFVIQIFIYLSSAKLWFIFKLPR